MNAEHQNTFSSITLLNHGILSGSYHEYTTFYLFTFYTFSGEFSFQTEYEIFWGNRGLFSARCGE